MNIGQTVKIKVPKYCKIGMYVTIYVVVYCRIWHLRSNAASSMKRCNFAIVASRSEILKKRHIYAMYLVMAAVQWRYEN